MIFQSKPTANHDRISLSFRPNSMLLRLWIRLVFSKGKGLVSARKQKERMRAFVVLHLYFFIIQPRYKNVTACACEESYVLLSLRKGKGKDSRLLGVYPWYLSFSDIQVLCPRYFRSLPSFIHTFVPSFFLYSFSFLFPFCPLIFLALIVGLI